MARGASRLVAAPVSVPTVIRPIAIGVFRRGDALLVGHGHDERRQESYCRPPGGAIEVGERAADALRREISEEVRAEIEEPRLLGVLENIFRLEGEPKHEIVFVFLARFRDPALYQRESLELFEPGWDGTLTWEPLSAFRGGPKPLYPEGLLALIDGD